MVKLDENALACDLAETYGIYDWRSLPLRTVATLSVGLREESRIMMRLRGDTIPTNTLLLAGILDNTSLLLWSKTKDGQKGRNMPPMLVDKMLHISEQKEVCSYTSGEEYEKERAARLEMIQRG